MHMDVPEIGGEQREQRIDIETGPIPVDERLDCKAMSQIVQARPATPNALLAVDGFGPGKVERYGAAILAKLHGNGVAAPPPAVADAAPAVAAEPSS